MGGGSGAFLPVIGVLRMNGVFMTYQSGLENISSLQKSQRVYARPCSIMLVPKVQKEENIQDHLNFPLTRDSEFQILKNSVGKRRKQIHFHITHLEEFQFSSIFRSLRVNPIYIHIADSSKELRPFWKLRDKLFWCHLMSQQQVRSSTTCQTIAQGL